LKYPIYQGTTLKKLNLFQSGFSIMEVMIAAALLGVVSIGVMQVTKNMTKSSKTDAQRVEFAQVTNQIQSLLRDEYSCEATLNGLNPAGTGSVVTDFKRKKSDGTTSNVLTSGQSYGTGGTPIFLKKMEIKNYNASSGIAEFWITMNKGRKDYNLMTPEEQKTVADTAYGSAVVPQILKVQVILDGAGNIKDCISDKDDYTSGACAMINGDWADKVNCKSIKVQGNGLDPSITAGTNLHITSGLTVGSTLSGDPGNGAVKISSNLDVGDKATVKNDTTITSGKLIFNDGDARINQVAGNNLYIENKAGTAGANLIVGKSGAARTTITSGSMVINKNGTITAGQSLEVIGDTILTGSGSTTVNLKVGNSNIQYNGTDLVLNKPGAGVVRYNDASTNTEVASKGFVNSQLGQALTGNPATLTTILSNLGTLVSGNPVQAIAATTCGFYTNMAWNGTRCVDSRTTNCTGNNMVKGFNNGAINCQPAVGVNQRCTGGQLFMGVDTAGNKICSNANNEIGTLIDQKVDAAIRAERARIVCTGGQAAGLCIVNGTNCPSGTSRVGNWGTTTAGSGCGGSTTGCGSGKCCTTGSHGFSNTGTESCWAARHSACGPATSGGTTIYANLTQVGCTMP
jgi:type II secretory pathway pseudopilin PulG